MSWVDEIEFIKAKNAEEGRQKRLELDHLALGETLPRSVTQLAL